MTLMQLDGAAGVLVRSGNIQVSLAVEPSPTGPTEGPNAPASPVPVLFAALETTGAALRTAHRTARDIVVERPTTEAVFRVTVPDGGTFGDGTRVGLVLTVDVPGDADVVRVPPVDVSGLSSRDVIRLIPEGDRLRVVPGAMGSLDTRRLAPLGSVAVAETRRLAAGTVEPVGAMRVVVDPSASMRQFAGGDDLGAVLEALTGVWEAAAAPRVPLEVVVWADHPRSVRVDDPETIAEAAAAELARTPPTIGFRSAGAAGSGLTVIVTDAVPADAAALLATATSAVCLVVLAATPGGNVQVRRAPGGPVIVIVPGSAPGSGQAGGVRQVLTGGELGSFVHGLILAVRGESS